MRIGFAAVWSDRVRALALHMPRITASMADPMASKL